jgi:hypothetical protein
MACKFGAQFLNRHVTTGLKDTQDRLSVCFDRSATPIAAQWPGSEAT